MGCAKSVSKPTSDENKLQYDTRTDEFDLTQHELKIRAKTHNSSSKNTSDKVPDLSKSKFAKSISADSLNSFAEMMDRINNFQIPSQTKKFRSVEDYAGISKTGFSDQNPEKINQDKLIMSVI